MGVVGGGVVRRAWMLRIWCGDRRLLCIGGVNGVRMVRDLYASSGEFGAS